MILIEQVKSAQLKKVLFYVYERKEAFHLQQIIYLNQDEEIEKLNQRTHLAFIDYALIEFNMSYRQFFYSHTLKTKVIIKPSALLKVAEKCSLTRELAEEVAITIEHNISSLNMDTLRFVEMFYQKQTKEEAIKYYENWQLALPINNVGTVGFIRLFEFYLDEILNYFDLKNALTNNE